MSSFEIEGKLHKVSDTQQVTESFAKRELVLEVPDDKYPQFVPFELFQDRCAQLDGFKEGEMVKVSFNLRGREWNSKFFCNLNAWRVERLSAGDTQAAPKQVVKQVVKPEGDDLPF